MIGGQTPAEGPIALSNIAAVVVHHRSYTSIAAVVEGILEQGIVPGNLVVVDNSEEPARQAELRKAIDARVDLLFTPNQGYGAAVNYALDSFAARPNSYDFLLVSTHEARPAAGAVEALHRALTNQPLAAVAGPTLVSGERSEFIWSTGGFLNRITGIPGHYDHRMDLDLLPDSTDPVRRQWLDGAFLIYRWEDIARHRVPEHYFLYMEETDLHVSLRKAGREVLWVPNALVWQDSNGIPAFYFARNLRLFLKAHCGALHALVIPPVAVTRRLAADVVRGRGLGKMSDYWRGLSARLPRLDEERKNPACHVHLINPLGSALKHYEEEIRSVLAATGAAVTTHRFDEPSSSGQRSVFWLWSYVCALIGARFKVKTSHSRILVLWPVLGYFDLAMIGLLGLKNVSVVMHDPHPLVRAVGYSKIARRLAVWVGSQVRLVAHSHKAQEVICEDFPSSTIDLLPHPVLPPTSSVGTQQERSVVRVLGQYKADRDLVALEELGRELSKTADLEVHGRGWPAIEGWKVVEGFVTELQLDELVAGSAVVLIPYKRFYQSGIAIRALEMGTPFVGPKESVLAEMLGDASPLLVQEQLNNEWSRAVRYAIEHGAQVARQAALRWREVSVCSWSTWVDPGAS